ncbi:hypothetical protein K440DRAFT_620554 [Wilcoxina mikolae CBS 423.85]|nr:hypothetical protein K440DRAFT_620554 [Wilcoxina mikolae CBS 423.85]
MLEPPDGVDAEEVRQNQRNAYLGAAPGQKIITYQEGPTYTIDGNGNHSHEEIPLTFEDWFGEVSNDNPTPVGITAASVFPIDTATIHRNILEGVRLTAERDRVPSNPVIIGPRTPSPESEIHIPSPE